MLEEYPEDITVSYDTGADGLSIVQLIIDVTNVMVPAVVSVVELLLTYKAQIKTEQLHQKELELKEKEIELNAQAKEEVEIRVTNSGETKHIKISFFLYLITMSLNCFINLTNLYCGMIQVKMWRLFYKTISEECYIRLQYEAAFNNSSNR